MYGAENTPTKKMDSATQQLGNAVNNVVNKIGSQAKNALKATGVSGFADYKGTMAPAWMQKIPNWAICNWFYMFFIVNLVVMVLLVGGALYAAFDNKSKLFTVPNMFLAFLQLLVAGTNTLFYFLICDRSLKPLL